MAPGAEASLRDLTRAWVDDVLGEVARWCSGGAPPRLSSVRMEYFNHTSDGNAFDLVVVAYAAGFGLVSVRMRVGPTGRVAYTAVGPGGSTFGGVTASDALSLMVEEKLPF